jgi:glycosyltransferase involved in cell wall biosynthesis
MLQAPTVHILLATYNGCRFITEQLTSIERQSYTDWTLTVSDDGSSDDTLEVVNAFAQRVSQPVTVLQGPRKGSTWNFCHLIAQAPTRRAQDLFAFCDQDDVWLLNKLERAVQWHSQYKETSVRLYCGRTQFVNERLQTMGLSPGIHRPPSFGNALVQNIASGNTMVFSQAVLLAQKKIQPQHSVWHDWTTYLVATALGGLVCFDDDPCLLYRQHTGNVVGANDSMKLVVEAFSASMRGRYLSRVNTQMCACNDIGHLITSASHSTLLNFTSILNNTSALAKLVLWRQSAIRRQTMPSNLALALALLTKRL